MLNVVVNKNSNSLIPVFSNHILYYPTPANLNYFWSFGSLVGLFFAMQIVSGIFLAMHYTPHVDLAFSSVEHIMADVNNGYLFRYFHANGASAVFIFMYLHIARNLYYQSYLTRPAMWNSGLIIFLLMMATAFIGYVLPWGQMSFWGATVITSLVTAVPAVGEHIAHWVWGGFSINNATLNRFFSAHYLLPFLVTSLVITHLVILHTEGSTEPLTLPKSLVKIPFHPYFSYKDAFIFTAFLGTFSLLVFYMSNLLGHSDNFIPANPLVTPAHIVPEWYFTPFYAILRACPNKLGGAIGMFSAIILLFLLPFYLKTVARFNCNLILSTYSRVHKNSFWLFIGIFFTLIFLGSNPAAAPYVLCSKFFTIAYFAYFLIIIPVFTFINSHLPTLKSASKNSISQKNGVVFGLVLSSILNLITLQATYDFQTIQHLPLYGGIGGHEIIDYLDFRDEPWETFGPIGKYELVADFLVNDYYPLRPVDEDHVDIYLDRVREYQYNPIYRHNINKKCTYPFKVFWTPHNIYDAWLFLPNRYLFKLTEESQRQIKRLGENFEGRGYLIKFVTDDMMAHLTRSNYRHTPKHLVVLFELMRKKK